MAELNYDYIAKLVRKTQAGDSDAFAELYAATYKKQYYFTYQYVKDSYLAQDILQDVSILVLKKIDPSDRDHCNLLSDIDKYSARRNCSYRYAGTGCLSETGFPRIDSEAFPRDSSGCDEPAVLLSECIHGNYDHIWFLCEK